jgi:SAM-dependent methyltransferase
VKTGFAYNFIQEAFARTYALTTGEDPYPLNSLLLREQHRLSPPTVLDVGCGSGRFVLSNCEYVGVDPNSKYIAYCRQHRTGRFEQMPGEHLNFPDGSFSLILCFSVGHHVPNETLLRVFGEIRRVLDTDGLFLFADVIRPIVPWRWAASLLEWLDEGESFRTEAEYVHLLTTHFEIGQREEFIDQFYRTVAFRCRKA